MGCDRQAHRSVPRRLRFNSRTRMGCDLFECFHVFSIVVSIHAPAWGATFLGHSSADMTAVSIHAPAWGATHTLCRCSRPCCVSIHAPAWGATDQPTPRRGRPRFQFTHPHGVRRLCLATRLRSRRFQFTHPHGVRRFAGVLQVFIIGFNSRTRMGCDKSHIVRELGFHVSIHAPAWGATKHVGFLKSLYGFQFTHPHGVRLP